MPRPNTTDPLVSVEWLRDNLARVRVIDGTWSMPASPAALPDGFIPDGFIKGAVIFDIDAVADNESEMAHMRPDAQTFAAAVSAMGISTDDTVVIYDRHGVFSAPRVWWTFKLFGHGNVYVLDGGLPAWIAAGHSTAAQPQTYPKSRYKTAPSLAKAVDIEDVLNAIESGAQIIDARPSGRFDGTVPEPRAGLRGGHMPGANNVPFGVLRTADLHFKSLADIAEQFGCVDLGAPIITTCGSGITAAGLAFSLTRLGAADVRVYDGSWTEYGARKDVPISCA